MIQQTFKDIYTDELAKDAIIHDGHTGFREDYLLLHCLLRKYNPKTVLEIGTNIGRGTKIIKNAVKDSQVYTLDLPMNLASLSQQHPSLDNNTIGSSCDLPFTQLLGDSLTFDYSKVYPIEGWYIDGEHDYKHALHESQQALLSNPKIAIWHDSDVEEVMRAILEVFDEKYKVFRVIDTRITYAIK